MANSLRMPRAARGGAAFLVLLALLPGRSSAANPFQSIATWKVDFPQAVAAADLDGDGHNEIIMAASGRRLYVAHIGTDGSLTSIQLPDAVEWGIAAGAVFATDVTGDRLPEIVVISETQCMVYRNVGSLHFLPPVETKLTDLWWPGITEARAVDFNSDGIVDFTASGPSVNILITIDMVGHAHLTELTTPEFIQGPHSVIGDFNGDGTPDLITSGFLGEKHIAYFRKGVRWKGFEPAAMLELPVRSRIVATISSPARRDRVVLANGVVCSPLLASDCFASPLNEVSAVADVDADGTTDLISVESQLVRISYGRGDGSFSRVVSTPKPAGRINFGDVNDDGAPDILAWDVPYAWLAVIYARAGTRSFDSGTADLPDDSFGAGDHVTPADLNGDGRADLMFPSYSGFSYAFSDGRGGFGSPRKVSTSFAIAEAVPMVEPAGVSVVAVTQSLRSLAVFGAVGTSFELQQSYATEHFVEDVVVSDLDNDGDLDVLATSAASGMITVGLRSDRSLLRFLSAQRLDLFRALALWDIDRDGFTDLLALSSNGTSVEILRGDGYGAFFHLASLPLPFACSSIAAGDLDGDGSPEVIAFVFAPSTRGVVMKISAGGAVASEELLEYRAASQPERSDSVPQLRIADIDGDGRDDILLAVAASVPDFPLLGGFLTRHGEFTPLYPIRLPFLGTVDLADVNDDGRLDLINASRESVQILLNGMVPPPFVRSRGVRR